MATLVFKDFSMNILKNSRTNPRASVNKKILISPCDFSWFLPWISKCQFGFLNPYSARSQIFSKLRFLAWVCEIFPKKCSLLRRSAMKETILKFSTSKWFYIEQWCRRTKALISGVIIKWDSMCSHAGCTPFPNFKIQLLINVLWRTYFCERLVLIDLVSCVL